MVTGTNFYSFSIIFSVVILLLWSTQDITITSFILDYATKSPEILLFSSKIEVQHFQKYLPPQKKNPLSEKLQGTSQDISVCISK